MSRTHHAIVPFLAACLAATLCACGGGGGGGAPLRFPLSGPTDLVAIAVDAFAANTTHVVVADVQGRGSVVVTDGTLSTGSQVEDIVWSSDHRLIAFSATADDNAKREVFVVDPQGGDPVSVSGDLGAQESDVVAWQPGGRLLAFRAAGGGLPTRLFVVRSDGAGRVEVSGSVPAGGSGVSTFAWAPDGSRLALSLDNRVAGRRELMTVLPNGTGAVQVSDPPPVSGGAVQRFLWAPDASRLLLTGDVLTDGSEELFTALPSSAAGRVQLNGPLPTGADIIEFAWAPDASRVAFLAEQVASNGKRLFTCLPDGTGRVAVSVAAATGGAVQEFAWAPDSSRLAYVGDVQVDALHEAFIVQATGASHVQVSGGSVAAGDVGPRLLAWAPDSSRLAFAGDLLVDGQEELFSVGRTGGVRARHSSSIVSGGAFSGRLLWDPSSTRLAYTAGHITPTPEPFVVPVAVPGPAALGDVLADGAFLLLRDWSVDGTRIVASTSPGGTSLAAEVRGYSPDGAAVVLIAGPFAGDVQDVVLR